MLWISWKKTLGPATEHLMVLKRAVLHPHYSASSLCAHGYGYAHARRRGAKFRKLSFFK